ncbi:MAG: type I-G CRISPR-associated protein Cas8g1/Csx17 [Gemmatimonadaceae bacterium]
MKIHVHLLKGCAPVPLADYLKALGILRLVGQQADNQARGWWDGECFRLMTRLSKEELERFFLDAFEPTPILSPWNKGAGFFKPNDPGLSPLEGSSAPRFARFREAVADTRTLLHAIANADATIRAIKARTKTNAKDFQTETQRQRLLEDEAYQSLLRVDRNRLDEGELSIEKRGAAEHEIETLEALVQGQRPTKAEAKQLKASSGYKRALAAADKGFKSLKASLVPNCRRSWRGPHAEWLAAAVVLDEEGNSKWPSLLGTGGNDGNLDFTNNYMQQLGALFDLRSETGRPTTQAASLLQAAIWSNPASDLSNAAVGQFRPGSAGGANASTGFVGESLINPWDFVFMMEGSLLFTARSTRRLEPNSVSRASAPFAVRSHAAGFASPGSEKAQRGEQWMPLWSQPATLRDVAMTFAEARVQLDRQAASRPIDMARAISRLGAARGVDAFVRYGYLERNGQSTLAVPLGRVQVRHHPRSHLIDDLSGWMDRIRRQSRDSNSPARLVHAEHRLADAVLSALTHDYAPDRWQEILLAAAGVESIQATGVALEARPVPPLKPEWVEAVDDGSAEVRLAMALGSAAARYTKAGRPIDPIRHHWLPLEDDGKRFKTAERRLVIDPRVVASGRDAVRDLAAVAERRIIESAMTGHRRSGLVAAPGCGARLYDLQQFLTGTLNLDKLLGLARAFMALQWDRWVPDQFSPINAARELPDEGWLSLRLANLPWGLTQGHDIPADPRVLRLLLSTDVTRAVEIACGRLRAAGIRPPIQTAVADPTSTLFWAAALAFPITRSTALRAAGRLDPSIQGSSHVRS